MEDILVHNHKLFLDIGELKGANAKKCLNNYKNIMKILITGGRILKVQSLQETY